MTARRHRLENGLNVILEPMHHAPVVAMQVWVSVGAADERLDQAGLAHLHEHMLFKGTEKRGVGEIARVIEAAGGEINAWTSFDQTVYHVVLAAGVAETGVDVLSDAVRQPAFDGEELAREIEVIVEEIQRSEDSPARRATRGMFELAFQIHPYRRPVLGTRESVRSTTREKVLEFYEAYYRPDNVTVVITGDLEEVAMLELVRKYFEDWKPKSAAPFRRLDRPKEEHPGAFQFRAIEHPVKESRLSLAWHVPGVRDRDTAALDALGVILGHGDSSRLYGAVRRNQRLVNDIHAYAYTPKDPGLFVIGSTPQKGRGADVARSVVEELVRLRDDGVDTAELEKARVMMLSESAYQRETMQGQARKLGFYETVVGDFELEKRYESDLRALTRESIRDAAERYLTSNPVVVALESETSLEADAIGGALEPLRHPRRRVVLPKLGQLGVRLKAYSNGARVLVRREASPVVAIRAVADGGLRWENDDTHGLTYLLASTWARAIEELDVDAFAAKVASLGGALSAFSGRNSLGLRCEVIRDYKDEALQLVIDALSRSVISEEELERERTVALERIRNRDDSAAGVTFDLFLASLFPHHPYGKRLVGNEDNMKRFSLDDVDAMRELILDPRRMVISVVGDVEPEAVFDAFDALVDGDAPKPLPLPAPPDPRLTESVSIRRTLDKKQSHVIVGAMGTTVDGKDRHALQILTTVLAGQSGRLFTDLRDAQSLAYTVSSSNVEGLDPGHVITYGATSPDKVEAMTAGLHRHLDTLVSSPIGSDELARAQRYLVGTHAIDLQRSGARAMVMALGELFGLGYDHYSRYAERIEAVRAADVQRVAKDYLSPERRVQVIVGPE